MPEGQNATDIEQPDHGYVRACEYNSMAVNMVKKFDVSVYYIKSHIIIRDVISSAKNEQCPLL